MMWRSRRRFRRRWRGAGMRRLGRSRLTPRAVARRIMNREVYTFATGADTETKLDIVSAVDAPTSLAEVETGTVIKGVSIDFLLSGAYPVNARMDFGIYKDNSNLMITSSTPLADYYAETLPMTKNTIDIRRAMLITRTLQTSNVQEPPIHLRFKLRKPVRMGEGDVLTFVGRSDVSTIVAGRVHVQGVCYK